MDQIINKASAYGTETIKDMAIKLASDFQEGADLVLNALLSILESRMPEDEFVAFCESMEAAI